MIVRLPVWNDRNLLHDLDRQLGCDWTSFDRIRPLSILINFPKSHDCYDKFACIARARILEPYVELISTTVDQKPHKQFVKTPDGEWEGFDGFVVSPWEAADFETFVNGSLKKICALRSVIDQLNSEEDRLS